MRLSSLIASSEGLILKGQDVDITGLTADSRKVAPGFLFIAIPGTQQDGRLYISDAIKQGAAAILAPLDTKIDGNATLITTPDIRKTVSALAAQFYKRQPGMIAAITGTSGKTSTAQFVREMWAATGHKSASIGTLGLVANQETRYGFLTTPDAITLHQLLDECVVKDITHVAMEASSHGLILNRLDNVNVKVGTFTNLSRDHLDYHITMEAYFEAKLRLFNEVMPRGTTAVLNADGAEFNKLIETAQVRGLKVISYGNNGKEIKLIEIKPDVKGQHLKIELFGKTYEVLLPLIGRFQVFNGLAALGTLIASSEENEAVLSALEQVTGVPGRLQLAGMTHLGAAVFIDYAHKPDALENVLVALRPHVSAHKNAQLGVVFGCGGNRDKGKRPVMGKIAQYLADWVIVTDDNPRHEDPVLIRKEILSGCTPSSLVREVGDRAAAIKMGIAQLKAHDVLVIAGKGHESGQIIGDITHPFDDAAIARKVLNL